MSALRPSVPYLDGIRGIAAFLVFAHHFLLVFYTSTYTGVVAAGKLDAIDIMYGLSPFSVLTNGNFWVHVFFTLSGFVLSRKYIQSNEPELLVSGMHRRFIRLFIPVAVSLLLVYVLMMVHAFSNVKVASITGSEWWFSHMWQFDAPFSKLLNSLFYSTMFQGDSIFNTVLWTISFELYGSLFVFAFLLFTHSVGYRHILLLLVFIYFYYSNQSAYVSFVSGIYLAIIEKKRSIGTTPIRRDLALTILALTLLLGSYPSNGNKAGTVFEHLGHTLLDFAPWYHTVGAYLLVYIFVARPSFQVIPGMSVFTQLGKISFSLYLLHVPVIGSVGCATFLAVYKTVGYHIGALTAFISTTIVLIPLSILFTKYVDDKAVALSKMFYEMLKHRHLGQLSGRALQD
ncbi:MAG: acyltransferase [Flavipsychrobacter sp.]|nr:acyltransferase [Flavipsychrobacter sp.]